MNIPEKPTKNPYISQFQQVIPIAFEMGFIIALPLVVFGLLGKWLDRKFNTHFIIFLGIILAIALTSYWLYRRLSAIVEQINQAAKAEKNDSKH